VLPKIRPVPIKDRVSVMFAEKCQIDVVNGAFVMINSEGVHTQVPLGTIACLMIEPGVRISHRAVELAARAGTLLVWVGEAGVRLYASGQPGGARSDKLLLQAKLALDDDLRLKVVRKMYEMRFNESAPQHRSVEQLRGIEGARVRKLYEYLAKAHGVKWSGRVYDPTNWEISDRPNRCLSAATSCLYGVTEAAVLAAGYAPAVGFVHTGKPLSFVYDIADIIKFDTVVPVAFKVAAGKAPNPEREIRQACREVFRKQRILAKLIPMIEEVLAAGGLELPKAHPEAMPVAFEEDRGFGDDGHRG